MAVIWRHTRADGSVTIERHDHDANTVELLASDHAPTLRKAIPGGNGFWLKSNSNGFMGTEAQFKKMRRIERKLGCAGDVEYKTIGRSGNNLLKEARYRSKDDYIRWMKANKRVNSDPGDGYPCPGDFRGDVPHEFEGMEYDQ